MESEITIDVSPVVPEARAIAGEAARIYVAHTSPWFVGLLIHGSALKGGFIPGSSDVDFQLFLEDGAFGSGGELSLEAAPSQTGGNCSLAEE